jgi:hypothetical protein
MPVRHARFHRTSKFADNDVFGGLVDENDVGFERSAPSDECGIVVWNSSGGHVRCRLQAFGPPDTIF